VVKSGGIVVTPSPRSRLSLTHNWISASDPRVMRARMSWHPDAAERIRVRVCDGGADR
ncbi:MAG: hypothetical protein QOH38_860, partial [Thermoleophilaceae bacterium]|nr:hypothetical protein [Thermoleophilaceae bacterium]